jgi:hypothetical protein
MTDINERVQREWKENSTSRERVKEIVEQTTEYTKAGDIATKALTSEPTTRKYLSEFVDDGIYDSKQDGRCITNETKADASTSESKNCGRRTRTKNHERYPRDERDGS